MIAIVVLSVLLSVNSEKYKKEEMIKWKLLSQYDNEKDYLIRKYVLPPKGIFAFSRIYLYDNRPISTKVWIMNEFDKPENFTLSVKQDIGNQFDIRYIENFTIWNTSTDYFNLKIIPKEKLTLPNYNFTVTVYARDNIYRITKLTLIPLD